LASVVSHAVAALSMGTCIYRPGMPKRVWLLGAMGSVVPDRDVIGFRFGVRYGDFWGLRGFTHSLVFAALIAAAAMGVGFRFHAPNTGRFPLFSYLFIAAASHGVLDAMTNGGLGVAFFAPFDNGRHFFPWEADSSFAYWDRPILQSTGLPDPTERASLDLASGHSICGPDVDVEAPATEGARELVLTDQN
jgi:inner membrane protein